MKQTNEDLRESLIELQVQLEQERARRQEDDLLLAGVACLATARDAEAVYAILVDVLGPLLQFDDAALFEVIDGALVSMAGRDHPLADVRLGIDPAVQRVLHGKSVAVFDTSKQPAWAEQVPELFNRARSALHIPISAGNSTAVLICVHAEKGFFSARHTRIAQRIGPMVSAALLSIQGFQLRLKRQSQATDVIIAHRDLLERALSSVGVGIGYVTATDLVALGSTLHKILVDWGTPDVWWLHYRTQLSLGETVRIGGINPAGNCFAHEATLMETKGGDPLLLIADVTRWTLAEEALQDLNAELVVARDTALSANRAKSSFLANMSHELRTPLNAIIGYGELMAEDAQIRDETETLVDLQRILLAARQLSALIGDVLDVSKIEAERFEMNMMWVDLESLLEDVRMIMTPAVERSGNTLQITCDTPLGEVWADKERLQQVLLNLLSNAIKFTLDGVIEIHVVLRHTNDSPDQFVVEVRDTGVGIPAECLEDIFQPFSQSDAGTTRRYGGTGLGLTISRSFCELMGGSLVADSTLNVGSIFTVLLPAKRSSDNGRVNIESDPDNNSLLFKNSKFSSGLPIRCT